MQTVIGVMAVSSSAARTQYPCGTGRIPIVPALLVVVLACFGCKSAKVTSEREFGTSSGSKPEMVYVSDFELGANEIKHEEGILSGRPGPVGRIGNRLSGSSEDPAVRTRQLVELMADSLVKDLNNARLPARRARSGQPLPSRGLLVRGIFTEVQEGNRVRRAIIGFGQGQTDIQVIAVADDLSKGTPKPLYEVATEASSGQKPGAAPTLLLSPYGAAARFVLAGNDLERNIRQAAAKIAERIAQHANQANHHE